jgi:hypothetical protein
MDDHVNGLFVRRFIADLSRELSPPANILPEGFVGALPQSHKVLSLGDPIQIKGVLV